jgi:hypothetical protein
MGVPEILDETFRLYRRHFLKLVAITLVVRVWVGPPLALPLISVGLAQAFFEHVFLWGLVGGPIYLAAHSLLVAALTSATSDGYLGHRISAKGAYRLAVRRVSSLLGVFLITTLASILAPVLGSGLVMFLVWFLIFTFAPLLGHYYYWVWFGILIQLLVLVLGGISYLWLTSRLALAVPVAVLEAASPRAALARSWRLTRGNKARALVAYAALTLLSLLFIVLPTFILLSTLGEFGTPEGLVNAVFVILPALLSALVMPIRVGGLALLYYDLRIRREGLDLALQAGTLGQVGAPGRIGTPQTAGNPGAPPS